MRSLEQLIEISRYYGENPAFVLAGGGNTSFKNKDTIWVKASGVPLAGIGMEGFVSLSRKKLSKLGSGSFSEDPALREEQVKAQMKQAVISPAQLRPSVETSLHNLIEYSFVVHTHPTSVNGLMCANQVFPEVEQRFGERALMVEYTDPGSILFQKLKDRITGYSKSHGKVPQIIFIQNHGVFVSADRIDVIRELYEDIAARIGEGRDLSIPSSEYLPFESRVQTRIAEIFKTRSLLTKSVHSDLIGHFTSDRKHLQKVSRPFTPDMIVYCKSAYLLLRRGVAPDSIGGQVLKFERDHGYFPRVILQEGGGLTVVEESQKSVQTVLDVYTDLMKISWLTEQFGGPHFMTPEQIRFIDNWEVEHYRREIAKTDSK
jgi:rhamnose utilization protein RhaD (predicted bifunctional aldolase and dehydrogenase)